RYVGAGCAVVTARRRQRAADRHEGRRLRAQEHVGRPVGRPSTERGAMTKHPMAVTMGDPSGVGPEIVLRHFAAGGLGDDVVVYGDAAILEHGADLLGLDIELDVV